MKINTLAEKKAYFEQVKLANFRESCRLGGITVSTTLTTLPNNSEVIKQTRQAIINRYK